MQILKKMSTKCSLGKSYMKFYRDKGKLYLDIDGQITERPDTPAGRAELEEEIMHYQNFLEDM